MKKEEIEKLKEDCYNEATLKSLGNNPQGTRMDVVYLAMDIYANKLKSNPVLDINIDEWAEDFEFAKYVHDNFHKSKKGKYWHNGDFYHDDKGETLESIYKTFKQLKIK